MNKLIIGIDVSKNDLDVAFWQNDKSFFLGKYPNNQNGFQTIYQDVEAKKQKINADTVLVVMVLVAMNSTLHISPLTKVGKSVFLIQLMSEAGIRG